MAGRLALSFAALLALAIVVAGLVDPPVHALELSASSFGEAGSGATVELYRPAGPGPFAAVVVQHGCNGVARSTRRWAARLRDWGYVAAVVDSFGPRGLDNVCGRGGLVSAAERGRDAEAASALLAARPDVKPGRIAVIGFSHGGGAALAAGTTSGVFAAAIAFYPWCPAASAPLRTDTLILIGDADDWTPAPRCTAFVERAAGQPVNLKVYPGALHAFDNGAPETIYFGHRIGGEPGATADAIARTRSFLAARLR